MKKYLFLLLTYFIVVILGATNLVLAETSFGNFDIYKNGDLNGQDGWSDVWNTLTVQDEITFDGTKAIKNQKFGGIGYKDFPRGFFEAGVVSAEIQIDNNSFSDNQDLFGIYKGIGEEFIALFRFANNFDSRQNMLLLSVAESTDIMELGQITQGEWHNISLGWRNSDYKIRIKVDDNDWSEWFDSQTSWGGGNPFGIRINLPPTGDYGDFYLSNLSLL